MACNLAPSLSLPRVSLGLQALDRLPTKNHAILGKTTSLERHLSRCKATQSKGVTEEEPSVTGSSARTQLNLLEQLTSSSSPDTGYESDGGVPKPTIRAQLSQLIGDRDGTFTIPLGKKLKAFKILNISQKRNIKRQAYLEEVSQRNDSVFYVIIGAFVILPPVAILSIAILTGYVQLFP